MSNYTKNKTLLYVLMFGLLLGGGYIFYYRQTDSPETIEVIPDQIESLESEPTPAVTTECGVVYTNSVFPDFTFEYDSCYWDFSEEKIANNLGEGAESFEIILENKSTIFSIELIPFLNMGLTGRRACVSEYVEIGGGMYRFENASLIHNKPVDLYSINIDMRGTAIFEEIITNDFSQDFCILPDGTSSTLEFATEDLIDSLVACTVEDYSFWTKFIYSGKNDEVIGDSAIVWATLDTDDVEVTKQADNIIKFMQY